MRTAHTHTHIHNINAELIMPFWENILNEIAHQNRNNQRLLFFKHVNSMTAKV